MKVVSSSLVYLTASDIIPTTETTKLAHYDTMWGLNTTAEDVISQLMHNITTNVPQAWHNNTNSAHPTAVNYNETQHEHNSCSALCSNLSTLYSNSSFLLGCDKNVLELNQSDFDINSNVTQNNSIGLKTPEFDLSVADICMTLVLISLIICIIIGNILVISSVLLFREMRTLTNALIVSLATADLLVAILVLPISLFFEISDRIWFLGSIICDFWITSDVFCCTASILNIVVIALDRYWLITRNVRYTHNTRLPRKRVCAVMVFLAWSISAIISASPLLGWKEGWEKDDPYKCLISQDYSYTVFSTFGAFWLPLSVILITYFHIFRFARKRARKRAKSRSICSAVHSTMFTEIVQGTVARNRTHGLPRSESISPPISANQAQKTTPYSQTNSNDPANDSQLCFKHNKEELHQITGHASNIEPITAANLVPNPGGSHRDQLLSPNKDYSIVTSDFDGEATVGHTQLCTQSSIHCESSVSNIDYSKDFISEYDMEIRNGDRSESIEILNSNEPQRNLTQNGAEYLQSSTQNDRLHVPNGVKFELSMEQNTNALQTPTNKKHRIHKRLLRKRRKAQSSQPRTLCRRYRNRLRNSARTLGMIIGGFVLCWMPFFILATLMPFCPECGPRIPPTVFSICLWLGYSNSLFNPVIYAIWDKKFRNSFTKIVKCRFKR